MIVHCLTLNSLTLNAGSLNVATSRRLKEKPIGYFKFADPEVSRIVAENWGDGTGTTLEQIEAVTNINNKFYNNTIIETFDEFEEFTGVTKGSTKMFAYCENLKSIILPNTMTTLPSEYYNGAFAGCTSLERINLDNIIELGVGSSMIQNSGCFSGCRNLKIIGDVSKITKIGDNTFCNCTSIPSELNFTNLESIGKRTFEGCSQLIRVSCPKLAGTLDGTFYKCASLEYVDLPLVTELASYQNSGAFRECTSLKEVNLPRIIKVNGSSFEKCYGLLSVKLGENLNYIGNSAFSNCSSMQYLIVKAITPPTLTNSNAFDNTNNCPIYVPDASVEAYKTATNWVTYAYRIKPLSDAYITLLAKNKYVGRSFNIRLLYGPLYEYEKGVTWSITSGSEYASIDQEGNVTINESANNSVITVRATSIYNDTIYNYIDITVTYADLEYLYLLPEETVFNKSNYIDTGVRLMDEDIDYTIYVRGVVNAYDNLRTIFHCIRESSPYPGILMDCTDRKTIRIGYGRGKGVKFPYTYGNEFELKVTHASGTGSMSYSFTTNGSTTSGEKTDYEFVKISQTLLIGAYQTIDGSKGRFLDGTISEFYISNYDEK